ncbi:MAG: hypothetical protein K9G46_07095 [Flavobacteriales bacterium]|nr:hypothetical protein [Flavobacteriales bacterium]
MALPCNQVQYDTWTRRCFNQLSQQVPCESLDQALLAAGQYEIQYVSPDGKSACYGGTITDVGDQIVHGIHGIITDKDSELRDGIIFWATVAATGLFLGLGAFLFIKELRKL